MEKEGDGNLQYFCSIMACTVKKNTNNVLESIFLLLALNLQSHLRCSNSFIMFWNEIKLQEHFSPLKVSCEDAKLNLALCQIYSCYNTSKSYSR